jgi:dolichol-phosphate mannosyltransferase
MNQLKLSIVIPAHNEEHGIVGTVASLIDVLDAANIPHEIVVVDDHSTDQTADVLRRLMEKYPTLRTVNNERAGGFGQAIHTGLDAFTGDAVCIVMGDGSDDPRDVVKYYNKLLEGYECVFGSRFTKESNVVNYPKHKLLINRIANQFIRLLFGLQYNDITNAFKCYRRSVIDGIRPLLSHHFNLTVELPLKAIVRGFSYAVVPIHWYGRVHGVSKLRIQEMGSRYLFIVLYVMLEKKLSRGDYNREGEPDPIGGTSWARYSRRPGWAWWSIGIVFFVQMLFAFTYPLNHLGGDAGGYEHVLINLTSNLVFAPGYMTLASLPLRNDAIYAVALRNLDTFREVLDVGQHLFEVFCLSFLLIALSRVYNRLTAFLAVLIAGTSARAMGVNSAVYPEWMQADLLVLSFSLAILAYTTAPDRLRKYFYYAAAYGAFTWCVLSKFNGIVFLPGLLAFIFFERAPGLKRVKLFAAAFLFGLANYAAFVLFIHKPATGTYVLTHDKSWVMMAKLESVYGSKLPYPQGIDTKRWLALSAVLPPSYDVASVGMFMNVDSVPPAVRAPMQQKVAPLLHGDEQLLDATLRQHALPKTFNVAISSIPISYYVGLAESDHLGVRVFRESVLHAPRKYLDMVAAESLKTFWYATTERTFPSPVSVTGVTERLVPSYGNWARLVSDPGSPLQYNANRPFIWKPGFQFFGILEVLMLSRGKTVLLMVIGVVIALWHGFRHGWTLRAALPIAIALLLFGFDVFSNALLAFRWKEWRLAYPLASILLGITFGWAVREMFAALGRIGRSGR